MHLDASDFQLLELLQKPEGQLDRIDDCRIDIDHDDATVDVQPVSGEVDPQKLDALFAQHVLDLSRAGLVHSVRATDHRRVLVEPHEAAALHDAGAVDGSEYRHADARQRLRDRLLLAAMIEARSCERFRMLSERIADEDLRTFYHELMISEAQHYTTFLGFARKYGGRIDVDARWKEFLDYEADIIQRYGRKETMHG